MLGTLCGQALVGKTTRDSMRNINRSEGEDFLNILLNCLKLKREFKEFVIKIRFAHNCYCIIIAKASRCNT